jgi:hypothetical protein
MKIQDIQEMKDRGRVSTQPKITVLPATQNISVHQIYKKQEEKNKIK